MMSNEELERKMAFIVDQQGQFASHIQRLEESEALVAQTGEIVGAPRQRDARRIQ